MKVITSQYTSASASGSASRCQHQKEIWRYKNKDTFNCFSPRRSASGPPGSHTESEKEKAHTKTWIFIQLDNGLHGNSATDANTHVHIVVQ